jgi:hypothetical protein
MPQSAIVPRGTSAPWAWGGDHHPQLAEILAHEADWKDSAYIGDQYCTICGVSRPKQEETG